MSKLDQLAAIGFRPVGLWRKAEQSIFFEIDESAETASNVLYAFAIEDDLAYIGKTTKTLPTRMQGYKTPAVRSSKGGTTNKKIHKLIAAFLEQSKSVKIFVLSDNGLLQYGGFDINLAAGLEDSLIRKLEPPWNGGRKETGAESLVPTERKSSSRHVPRSS